MRDQTPIQQQRGTQTQLSRGRPHNPSLARRNQSPGQRASPLRQMQQQTRQRTKRQRKNTPLPEKRRRKRQTTHRSHANTTQRHMVNHPPPFHNNRKDGARRKAESREQGTENREQDKANNKRDTVVFGDNVRARWAARALPRTPTRRGKGRRRQKEEGRQTTRPHTLTQPAPPPFHNPQHSATHKE